MADVDASFVGVKPGRSAWALVSVFTLSIFLSATLLFSVQPMFAKLVLPLLGGSSNVWNTAMVFFQAMLLGGYIYAHLISKYLPFKIQIGVHGLVMSAGLLFLPLTIASGWTPPEQGAQAYWLMALFAVSVGVPFFAISANAPLLQRWFSRTDDKNADDPYFLYAASNAGSLLSLCLYPILIEPALRLGQQTDLWANGYRALIFVIIAAGVCAVIRKSESRPIATQAVRAETRVTHQSRLLWVLYAFIPSSLMLGVTSYITTDIASAPFLWIVPLALYLLTFVIVFAKNPIATSKRLGVLFPWVIIAALVAATSLKAWPLLAIGLSLACYFVIALMSHARLVEARPDAQSLTEFYIWMSLGGVLGGAFNALLAPLIFVGIYEYALILCAALFLKPGFIKISEKPQWKLVIGGAALSVLVLAVLRQFGLNAPAQILFAGIIMLLALRRINPSQSFLLQGVASLVAIAFLFPTHGPNTVFKDRSFFGVLSIETRIHDVGLVHQFIHGSTVHNYQMREPELQRIPLAYYAEGGTFDRAVKFARTRHNDLSVAMIGLGAGAMACHETAQDTWTYFEIDPAVVDMALNPKNFSYMQDCSYQSKIHIGDARLKITELAPKSQDIIMVDAFSSNVIPAHLVTIEALELYQSRLKDDGLIFFHTSNRMLDVSSVVVELANSAGLEARYMAYRPADDTPYKAYVTPSDAVLIGSSEAMAKASSFDSGWQTYRPSPDVGIWTDDYSHVLGTLIARQRKNGYPLPSGEK